MRRLALITGGHTGIGLGIARALAADGFDLALASIEPPEAPAVAAALEQLGGAARYWQHDVTDIAGHAALLERIAAEQGEPCTYVSNAGVPAKVRGDLLEMAPDSYDAVMDVNLRGAFFLAQAVARQMLAQEGGGYCAMAFVTSVSARMVSVERGEYCISKAGAAMMAQLFAARLAPHGIGVFELRPGIIETGMTAGVRDRYTAAIEDGLVPAARWGTPQDIGRIVVPLARGDLAFATGAAIPVDGGLSIPRL